MKLHTVVTQGEGMLVYGSPKYPFWVSDEPDIYVCEKEYSDEDYARIRAQADGWRVEARNDRDDDHGYDQVSSDTWHWIGEISDKRILVKDGAFFGIIENMFRRSNFYRRVYVSVNTAEARHGLWRDHAGYSSDNGSYSEDTILYLIRAREK